MRFRFLCPAFVLILGAALPTAGIPLDPEGAFDFPGGYGFSAEDGERDDTDGDGLTDAWEITHFRNLRDQTSADDPDADGQNNLAEMQAGTSPVDPFDH